MNPVAFHLGPLTIRWYGILVALGFLAAFVFCLKRARERNMSPDRVSDLLLWVMVGGIAGARLSYVFYEWRQFISDPWEILRVDHGGLVFYGGLVGAVVAVLIWGRIRRMNILELGDILAPAVPLGHAVGRVGCFLNGCCFGHPYEGFCSVRYLPGSAAAHVQSAKDLLESPLAAPHPVFPIQLVAALTNLLLVAVLLWAEKRFGLRYRLFALYMLLYGVTRVVIEFGRGDYLERLGLFTPSQVISLFIVAAGALLWRLGTKATDERLRPVEGTHG